MIKATEKQLAIISLLSPDLFKLERFEDGNFTYTSPVADGYLVLYVTANNDKGYYHNDIKLHFNMTTAAILGDEKLEIVSITANI